MVVQEQVLIRTGTPNDLLACVSLVYQMQLETHWHQYPKPPIEDVMDFLIGLPFVAVAEWDDELIGMCGASLEQHPCFQSIPYVLERSLYVHPLHRRGVIGMRLIRAIRQWGLERGARGLVIGRPTRHGETMHWYALGGGYV